MFFELQLVLAMGNYLNKGNARVDQASGFKVNFLTQVMTDPYFKPSISLIPEPVHDRVIVLIRSCILFHFTSFSNSHHKSLPGVKKGERTHCNRVTKQNIPLLDF